MEWFSGLTEPVEVMASKRCRRVTGRWSAYKQGLVNHNPPFEREKGRPWRDTPCLQRQWRVQQTRTAMKIRYRVWWARVPCGIRIVIAEINVVALFQYFIRLGNGFTWCGFGEMLSWERVMLLELVFFLRFVFYCFSGDLQCFVVWCVRRGNVVPGCIR